MDLNKSKSKQQKPITEFKMSKDKKLRKIVIDKLFHKSENLMKQSTRSNAPTESTPNQPKNFSKAIQNFFYNFEAQCAIIYEPIRLKDHKPMKRSLEEELNLLYKNDKRLSFNTQESHSLKSSPFFKNSSAMYSSVIESNSRSRAYTQNSNCQSRSKQHKNTHTDAEKLGIFKSKSMLFSTIQNSETNAYKPKIPELQNRPIKQLNRMESTKQFSQKMPPNLFRQENQYMTNSKYVPSKYMPRNAPMKAQERPQKVDRMKRIQSLKNLNENGARKYSYKRDL